MNLVFCSILHQRQVSAHLDVNVRAHIAMRLTTKASLIASGLRVGDERSDKYLDNKMIHLFGLELLIRNDSQMMGSP
jgi:hypothetical protein